MKFIRSLFFKWFKFYERVEIKVFPYREADLVIKNRHDCGPDEFWKCAKEEALNKERGAIFLERVRRIR